jgi:hypothetical protein
LIGNRWIRPTKVGDSKASGDEGQDHHPSHKCADLREKAGIRLPPAAVAASQGVFRNIDGLAMSTRASCHLNFSPQPPFGRC